MKRKALVIGSGFAGMSVASFLAKDGWQVTVLEKHPGPGGRARQLKENGFTFDMGPSWYWMPDVYERYFNQFGKSASDYYRLARLDPSYRVYWPDDSWDIPANYEELKSLFENFEPGAAHALDRVMKEAAFKYDTGIKKLVFKPGQSWREFFDVELLKGMLKLDVFTSVAKHFSRHFNHPKILELLSFPVLFLGALAENTPALYSLMNYADIKGGTWFPEGGMYQVVAAMHSLATSLGVNFHFGQNVQQIQVQGKMASGVVSSSAGGQQHKFEADIVVSNADYHFTETQLLAPQFRTYSKQYWESRVMAPSSLVYYVGINKKLMGLAHHSLFFDVPFAPHAADIYTTPKWPDEVLFYVSATSVTDKTLAPPGSENLFFLIPVAAGIDGDDETLRTHYFNQVLARFEKRTGNNIQDHIVYYRSFAGSDFKSEYNAFKGNAYGLANTLLQTAVLKPSCTSKKIRNLFYTGQLTVPGPGVPPSLISGEVVAGVIKERLQAG